MSTPRVFPPYGQGIASANGINPKNLQNWKKLFLENAEVAMEPAKAVKE
jgi:putative transposase